MICLLYSNIAIAILIMHTRICLGFQHYVLNRGPEGPEALI